MSVRRWAQVQRPDQPFAVEHVLALDSKAVGISQHQMATVTGQVGQFHVPNLYVGAKTRDMKFGEDIWCPAEQSWECCKRNFACNGVERAASLGYWWKRFGPVVAAAEMEASRNSIA